MDVSLPLSSFVCITGENNGGKSSVLQAISLFLSGSTLRPSDFFDMGQPVTIELLLEDVTDNDLRFLADEHRERIAKLITDGSLHLVRRYGTDGKSQIGYFGMMPVDQRFSSDHVTELIRGKQGAKLRDAVVAAFPELQDQASVIASQTSARALIDKIAEALPESVKEAQFIPLPIGLDKSVIPMLPERIYIPAVKDLNDDTKTAESSSFGKILSIVIRAIEPLLADENDLFDKLSRKLTRVQAADGTLEDTRLPEIRQIEQTIERFVRESFSSVSLEIEIPPPELRTVLSTARILADDGIRGPLELKGDGLRRAVVFSILRTYVELANAAPSDGEAQVRAPERGYLLLFEEPELFLHPDAQKQLFDALGVFSKKHHVVVTTHSPLFLGPESTATFIRLSKTSDEQIGKPFTKARHVDLAGTSPRDEFQIICFENNSAAFFAKRVVLVEGDSDFIVFPHIAKVLNQEWNCRTESVAFVRVGGKGSIARYRQFFNNFDVPVFVIADLDCLDSDFEKLNPSIEAQSLRQRLLQAADDVVEVSGLVPALKSTDVTRAQSDQGLRDLWAAVQRARADYEADHTRFAALDDAVGAFFAWEKKHLRRDCIQQAGDPTVQQLKSELLWELRSANVFVLERGALDDYYPPSVTGSDKPSRAQAFCSEMDTPEKLLSLCSQQTCPTTGETRGEFEFICSQIFESVSV